VSRSSVREAIKAGDIEELQKIMDVHLSRYYEEVRHKANKRKIYEWRCYVMRKFSSSILVVVFLLSVFSSQAFSAGQKITPRGQYNLTDYQKISGKKITKFDEAPQLAELAKQGKIPPVGQRIPKNPAVVEPQEEIGQYGGTWRRYGHLDWATYGYILYEPLVRWGPDLVTVEPNIAEKWRISKDGKTFTFYIRKGIKWSDGTPFTADDIMFWYEDIILNKELTPNPPTWLMLGGEVAKFKKLDDYTIEISFVAPYGLFLQELGYRGREPFAPKNYLKQFHPKYTSKEKLDSMAKEAGFQYWYQLFGQKNNVYSNPDLPVIYPWKVVKPWGAEGITAERNPYYWKIDSAGNQLPYLDRVTVFYTSDWKMAYLRIISEKATDTASDMQAVGSDISDYTLYMENRDKGGYRVLLYPGSFVSQPAMMFNQNAKDPVLRSIFRNVKFRQAMSLAINRDEINKLLYLGLAEPLQATIVKTSPFYKEEFAKAYAEYDPERANKLLDEIGLKRGPDGYRLRPDGKRLEIVIETRQPLPWPDVAEMVSKYWNAVGVKTDVKEEENSLWTTRVNAGEHEVVTQGFYCHPLLVGNSSFNLTGWPAWAPLWQLWYKSGGKSGEKPIEDVIRILNLWEKYKATTNPDYRVKLGEEIMKIHAKNLWIIGAGGRHQNWVCIAKNNFRNVPPSGSTVYVNPDTEGFLHPEQFFIKK